MRLKNILYKFYYSYFRIDFITKKGRIGGDKRKIDFSQGSGDKMILKTSGIITKDASVSIGPGLPNTTSKYFYHSTQEH